MVDNSIISINELISTLNNNFIIISGLNKVKSDTSIRPNIKLIDIYNLFWYRIIDEKKYFIILKKK